MAVTLSALSGAGGAQNPAYRLASHCFRFRVGAGLRRKAMPARCLTNIRVPNRLIFGASAREVQMNPTT